VAFICNDIIISPSNKQKYYNQQDYHPDRDAIPTFNIVYMEDTSPIYAFPI